ncbi:hypothetical protein [Bacillus niameyensis]|uniref:hypothetical protein n=1 Tax=Bacillus niameyensis TaxID=1522308 RepID=UPI0007818DF8|nr:hypothetical protein [Bacillus niameyensis]
MQNHFKKLFITVFSLTLVIGLFLPREARALGEYNIPIDNPGFEEPIGDENIPGWKQSFGVGKLEVVDTRSFTGDYSLYIADNDEKSYGLETDYIEIDEGASYTAEAMTYVESGKPSIYLRFYNKDHVRLDQKVASGGSVGEWSKLTISATAPTGTAYATIILYSTTTGIVEAYFDDVVLQRKAPENELISKIGIPIQSITIPGASYGKGPNGEDWIYAVANGNPAVLNVIDAHTGERVYSFNLPGAHNSWGSTVSPDGTLYLASGRNGNLYRWVPGSDGVEIIQTPVKGQSYIWRVITDDEGRVYGGTYPEGKIFQYDPKTNNVRDYGQMVDGVQYARSIAYGKGKVYAGIGTPAYLVELDPETGEKEMIDLPEEFKDQSYVYDLTYVGNHLFARMSPGNATLVYDVVKNKWVDTIHNTIGFDVSQRGPKNKVYLRRDTDLFEYDLRTHELTTTGVQFLSGNAASRGFGWITLGGKEFPGRSLVSIDSRGNIFIYNPLSGNHKTVKGDVEGQPNDIQSLATGPDGNIYIGGYLSPQGMGMYDPDAGKLERLDGIGQIEGMGVHQSKLYMGTYPGAHIFEYDLSKPWDFGNNPVKIFSLSGEHKQDRPFAFVSTGDKLAIGTVPDYGELGGALTMYEPNTRNYDVHRNVVENQSIIELEFKDGLIYGGTSIWGGYGIDPTEEEAKMFILDPSTNKKIWEGIPIPGEEAVSALTFDDEGYLWGLTAGYIFKFDPKTREVIASKELFPYSGGGMYYRGRNLMFDENGDIYGTTLGNVFKLDPDTFELQIITQGAFLFAKDRYDDFYFAKGAELYKINK